MELIDLLCEYDDIEEEPTELRETEKDTEGATQIKYGAEIEKTNLDYSA